MTPKSSTALDTPEGRAGEEDQGDQNDQGAHQVGALDLPQRAGQIVGEQVGGLQVIHQGHITQYGHHRQAGAGDVLHTGVLKGLKGVQPIAAGGGLRTGDPHDAAPEEEYHHAHRQQDGDGMEFLLDADKNHSKHQNRDNNL